MEVYSRRIKSKIWIPFIILVILLLAAAVAVAESQHHRDALALQLSSIDLSENQIENASGAWKNTHTGNGSSIESAITKDTGNDMYITPEGFRIISHSKKWTGDRLKEIYQELLNNAHGVELQYINSVIVYPGSEEWGDRTILGSQSSQETLYEVSLDLPAFIPDTAKYVLDSSTSKISLYNMDQYDTAADAAKTIAHEYGHHFTRFYFFKDQDKYSTSEYYKLRSLKKYPKAKIYEDRDAYMKNYEWDILEMAAEDYVQLLGSKNAKRSQQYKDISQWLNSGQKDYKADINNNYFNVFPQNNIFLPLASQVKGLDAYFHSFLNDGYKPSEKKLADIKISFKKRSKNGHKYYDVKWNTIPGDKGAIYTLLCYDKDGALFMPVKTVMAGNKMSAVIGTPSYRTLNYIYYWSDNITKKSRIFKVTVLLKNGTVISSKPVSKSF